LKQKKKVRELGNNREGGGGIRYCRKKIERVTLTPDLVAEKRRFTDWEKGKITWAEKNRAGGVRHRKGRLKVLRLSVSRKKFREGKKAAQGGHAGRSLSVTRKKEHSLQCSGGSLREGDRVTEEIVNSIRERGMLKFFDIYWRRRLLFFGRQ